MPQNTHAFAPAVGLAGLIEDSAYADVRSYVAAVDIPFGRMVEVNASGQVVLPLSTTLGRLAGIAARPHSKDPYGVGADVANSNAHGWKAGDIVPVICKGQVWAEFDGTAATAVALTPLNVRHPSGSVATTVAVTRGKLTNAAADVDAGEEITATAGVRVLQVPTANVGLARVEVNFPQ